MFFTIDLPVAAEEGALRTVGAAGVPGRVVGINEIVRACGPVAMVSCKLKI